MKLTKRIIPVLFVLLSVLLFSTNAFAKPASHAKSEGPANASGFDLRLGLAADIHMISGGLSFAGYTIDTPKTSDFAGLTGKIAFGYRWAYGGIYIDQDLSGVWWNGDDESTVKSGWFIGGTYLVGRGIYPINKKIQIDVGFGLGVMYAADPISTGVPIIVNKDGDPSAAFAIKSNIAFTYYFTRSVGFGVFFDYNYATKSLEDSGATVTFKHHSMNPGLQLMLRM